MLKTKIKTQKKNYRKANHKKRVERTENTNISAIYWTFQINY